MINPYAIGFALVAITAVAGTDYAMKSRAEGLTFGAYPVGDYVTGHLDRYRAAEAARDKARRQGEAARLHLPEPPDGWERRAFVPDFEAVEAARLAALPEAQRARAAAAAGGLVGQMRQDKARAAASKAIAAEVWEYVRGDEVIRLSARFVAGEEGRPDPEHMRLMAAAGPEGYALIAGVPYMRAHAGQDMVTAPEGGGEGGAALRLEAYLGDQVRIGVFARAGEAAVRDLLAGIDHDALNLMLDQPLAAVGSMAPEAAPGDAAGLAAAAAAAHRDRLPAGAVAVPEPVAQEPVAQETAVSGAGTGGGMVRLGAGGGGSIRQAATATGANGADGQPRRLQLSGGRSCLNGGGALCGD